MFPLLSNQPPTIEAPIHADVNASMLYTVYLETCIEFCLGLLANFKYRYPWLPIPSRLSYPGLPIRAENPMLAKVCHLIVIPNSLIQNRANWQVQHVLVILTLHWIQRYCLDQGAYLDFPSPTSDFKSPKLPRFFPIITTAKRPIYQNGSQKYKFAIDLGVRCLGTAADGQMESPRAIHGRGSWLQHLVKSMETSMNNPRWWWQRTKLHLRRMDSPSFLIARWLPILFSQLVAPLKHSQQRPCLSPSTIARILNPPFAGIHQLPPYWEMTLCWRTITVQCILP